MNAVIFLYHVAILFFLVFVVVNFLLNQLAVPRLLPGRKPASTPLVSILVPARNEEAVIERCLRSLQAQDYPNYEIILLDDQSTDGTVKIAEKLGFVSGPARFRIISGQPLESGWVGKNWACHQLSQAARGDYLLFTDADTDHSPAALSAVMAEALESKTDLLTLWPAQETITWSEKLVIPLLFVAAGGMGLFWLLRLGQQHAKMGSLLTPRQWRNLGAANGQYVLFTRDAYQKIGGHAAVKNHLVEDVALGRLVAEKTGEGMILKHCDGTGVLTTRMYQSFRQLWEGFTKNAWPVFEGNLPYFCIGMTIHFLVFAGPFMVLPFASLSWWMLLFQIVLIYFIRAIFALRYQSSWFGAVAHPFGIVLITAIAINSFCQSRKKGLIWKGRTYQAR